MSFQNRTSQQGFSFVEILVAFAIFAFFFLGVIGFFVQITTASQTVKDGLMAMTEAQTKIEEIRNHNFADIAADYASGGTPGSSFATTLISGGGRGWIYIDTTDPELYVIEIHMHWLDRFGRRYGEDLNLNGAIDSGEDVNSNGKLDSTITLQALLAKKI